LRSDSSPSSSATVSGVKAQSRFNCKDAWHSLAIKPDKMRERGGRNMKKARGKKREKGTNQMRRKKSTSRSALHHVSVSLLPERK